MKLEVEVISSIEVCSNVYVSCLNTFLLHYCVIIIIYFFNTVTETTSVTTACKQPSRQSKHLIEV